MAGLEIDDGAEDTALEAPSGELGMRVRILSPNIAAQGDHGRGPQRRTLNTLSPIICFGLAVVIASVWLLGEKGDLWRYRTPVTVFPFAMGGYAYVARLPEPPSNVFFAVRSDSLESPTASQLQLYEDGRQLGPAHTPHVEIREVGMGRYSHWGDELYFSSSDGRNPQAMDRKYFVSAPITPSPLLRLLNTFVIVLLVGAGLTRLSNEARKKLLSIFSNRHLYLPASPVPVAIICFGLAAVIVSAWLLGEKGDLWRYRAPVTASQMLANGGYAYVALLPEPPSNVFFAVRSDSLESPTASQLQLYEDGRQLGPAHTLHVEIREVGMGRYSHWGSELYFSSNDGSNPQTNGRQYLVSAPIMPGPLLRLMNALLIALFSGVGFTRLSVAKRKKLLPIFSTLLLLLAAAVPIALVAWYVTIHAHPVPVGDQWWDVVYIAVKTRAGTLTSQDLLMYTFGHRPVVIRLITLLFTELTDFNVRVLRFASFLTALFNLGLVVVLLIKDERKAISAGLFMFSVVLFTIYHSASWLDYYFSQMHEALFFCLLGLLAVQRMRSSWLTFIVVILCAIASSLSTGFGLAAWISLPIAALGIPAYRRSPFLALWLAALTLFGAFYFSHYAVSPYANETVFAIVFKSLGSVMWPLLYLIPFQAARFDIDTTNVVGVGFTLICSLVFGLNLWRIAYAKGGIARSTLWGSLALFAIMGALLTAVGSGVHFPVPARYSPGGDGFWLAFVAIALLVLMRRPPISVAVVNLGLLAMLVLLTAQKNNWAFAQDPYPQTCDECVLDYPLRRDGCLRECFFWSEDQSVYHLAALRLSVFHDEPSRLILPRTDGLVITDMPHRWLSVYVRDYLLAGISPEKVYSIAPERGEWKLPEKPYSPFYQGEWSTDILPQPLMRTWTSAAMFASNLAGLVSDHPVVWYLNTPETNMNFATIQGEFAKLDYTGQTVPLTEKRYGHFGLWCFERAGSGACSL